MRDPFLKKGVSVCRKSRPTATKKKQETYGLCFVSIYRAVKKIITFVQNKCYLSESRYIFNLARLRY